MKKRYSIGLLAVLVIAACLTVAAAVESEKKEAEEQEAKVALDQVPPAVKAALEAEAKGGKIVDVEKKTEDGKTVYEAEIQVGGKETDVTVAEDGKVLGRESEEKESVEKGKKEKDDDDEKDEKDEKKEEGAKLTLDQVPAAVKATIERESAGAKIEAVEKEDEDGKVVYAADLVKGAEKSEIKVAEDGKMIEREMEVTLEQTPAAVKAALQAEAKGGKIEGIEKLIAPGKPAQWTADIEGGEKPGEVTVAEDGKVLQREEQGKEEKEKEGDEDEDEKDEAKGGAEFVKVFNEDKADLGPTGRNDYCILEPGYVLTLQSEDGGEELVITVLDETKDVDGVKTRVVEERESEKGKVTEISRNWFAIGKKTNNVYYFGEESKEFEDGKVKSTSGSWESGKNGAKFGLAMPARPKVGERYYQEIAQKDKAMDRAETVSLTEKVTVPAGTFENCLKTKESSAVEAGTEAKLYAPGVGLLIDGEMKLVKYGPVRK